MSCKAVVEGQKCFPAITSETKCLNLVHLACLQKINKHPLLVIVGKWLESTEY